MFLSRKIIQIVLEVTVFHKSRSGTTQRYFKAALVISDYLFKVHPFVFRILVLGTSVISERTKMECITYYLYYEARL